MTNNAPASKITRLIEEGLDHVATGRRNEASQCFEDIIRNPGNSLGETDKVNIAQAHNQLGIMKITTGLNREALGHFNAAAEMGIDNPGLAFNRGLALFNLECLDEAEDILKGLVKLDPANQQATFYLGKTYQKQGRFEEAADYFKKSTQIDPSKVEAVLELGISLERAGREKEAAEHYDRVREISPDLFQLYYKKAEDLKENHFFPDAVELLVRAGKILPPNPIPHHMVAILFQDLGEKDKAEEFLKKSLALHPTPESYGQLAALYEKSNALNNAWATANTALQFFPDDPYLHLTMARCERRAKKYDQALARLKELEGKIDDLTVQTQMHFLMGWLYDQHEDTDSAYDYYSRAKKGAAVNVNKITADKEVSLQYIRDMKQLDLSKLPAGQTPKRPQGPAQMAFLVGFPRSGTTLLNQILDSHPRLVGLEEKPTIPGPARLLQQTADGYPGALENLDDGMVEKLREAYYQRLGSFTDYNPDSIVIDKLPLNLIHLPLIWAMFPDAKIILALRHPLGSCLSCFMHNFRPNNAMAHMFTLDNITSLYAGVMDLWRHFVSVHQFPHHIIKYEQVVSDIQGEAKRICDFLEIEWSEEMLQYAKHARAKGLINTPSYHQVVRPLYSESLERWRRYEKHLEPYKDRLRPYCDLFGYPL